MSYDDDDDDDDDAVSAAGPATRLPRWRPTAHMRYRRRQLTTVCKTILAH